MRTRILALAGVVCFVLLTAVAAGGSAGALATLGVMIIAAGYGTWRYIEAYRLAGSRIGLTAAAISFCASFGAVGAFAVQENSVVQAGAASSVGVVAAGGFSLSRSRHWKRLAIGLGLPAAIESWRDHDEAPLEELIESACGEEAAAHAARTAALAHSLAEMLTLSERESRDLLLAALTHPLGAVVAGDRAEGWPGPNAAASRAANLLDRIPRAAGAAEVLRYMNERWDGTGPMGLAGERIPLGSRVLAAVDCFEHAGQGGPDQALSAMREGSGTAFDPVVAAELVHFFRVRPDVAAA